jgi:hypothetical protein
MIMLPWRSDSWQFYTPRNRIENMEIPDTPNWNQVLTLLKAHVRPGERILAPDHFLNEFAQIYPPHIRRHWIDFTFDWFVLHVEAIARMDRAVLRDMLANAYPVLANPYFFVFTRRRDLPQRSLQEPAFQQLQTYLMSAGLIGAERAPPVKRGAVITTFNRPAMLEATVASVAATGAEVVVVDDGSMQLNAPRNQAITLAAGGTYLFVPGNRGLPTALNCGLSFFLADESVTWISTFNDDVAVDPTLYQVLGKLEATREFPLMSGYLSPHHKALGTRSIGGHEVQLMRSMPGQHIHAARDYWRFVMPIPTPYLGAPKPTGNFDGQGADEDWWIGSYAPRSIAKTGGFIAVVPDLVTNRGLDSSTWAPPGTV